MWIFRAALPSKAVVKRLDFFVEQLSLCCWMTSVGLISSVLSGLLDSSFKIPRLLLIQVYCLMNWPPGRNFEVSQNSDSTSYLKVCTIALKIQLQDIQTSMYSYWAYFEAIAFDYGKADEIKQWFSRGITSNGCMVVMALKRVKSETHRVLIKIKWHSFYIIFTNCRNCRPFK